MGIRQDISELLREEIIDEQTAVKIRRFYDTKYEPSANRLFTVFAVLGATLVGLGIILIVAHNWDNFPRSIKTVFAFVPLVTGQLACVYVILRKSDSQGWREGAGSFLFFSIGASISLVSQIYNIPGNLSSFSLTWMLLSLPVIYILRSSIVSLLTIVGITYYACETGYWSYPESLPYPYWVLLFLIVPYYYRLYKNNPESNFLFFHHWFISLSVVISLGTMTGEFEFIMMLAYVTLFGFLYIAGSILQVSTRKFISNAFKIVGALGSVILLITLSFNWFWDELQRDFVASFKMLSSSEFISLATLTLGSVYLLYRKRKSDSESIEPIDTAFLFVLMAFIVGLYSVYAAVLINILILAIALIIIRNGAKNDHLGVLNFGLMIITALVVSRFFDTNISFVIRGILFLLVGAGFFAANYWLLRKRRSNEI